MGDRKYGICLQPCTIQLIPLITNNTGILSAGTLFQIQNRMNFSEFLIKRLLNNSKTHINYESESYICNASNFKEIDYKLFLLLLAVKPEKRLNVTHDEPLMTFIRHLHENQRVLVPKTSIRGRENDLDCVVRYIGVVPEIGLGIFIGLILVNPADSIPIHGTLAQKYLRCDNSKGFIRAVDVFQKWGHQNYNIPLKSFPSVNSIDPYGSMESLSSERSFGNAQPRRGSRSKSRQRNNNKGMTLYNANNPIASGIDLISFEPVNPNYGQPGKKQEFTGATRGPVNVFNLTGDMTNMRVTNNVLPVFQMLTPLQYQLPKPEPKLEFTVVPDNMMQNIIKSNQNLSRDKLRQKYELLKKELDDLKNSKTSRSKETVGANLNKPIGNQNLGGPQRKYRCSLKSCIANKPMHMQRRVTDYKWDGNTEFYTNSIHQVKCYDCQELKLKCYTSKLYGANREFNAFINLLKESGFNVSLPENKYLSVTNKDKTKVVDHDKKREPYYMCTIRPNITINKNRFKAKCKKCNSEVDTSQGISLATCHHIFCNNCIVFHIKESKTPVMKCPVSECPHKLVENEIHAYMNETEFQEHLLRLEAAANLFYCTHKSCNGCIPIQRANRGKIVLLYCPECGQFNCMDCKTIHTGLTCEEFQRKKKSQNLPIDEAASQNLGALAKNLIIKCKVDKCSGYLVIQPNEAITLIACPECSTINCRTCQEIHHDLTCYEYQCSKRGTSKPAKTMAYNDDEWVCSNCTYLHKEKLNRCKMCLNQRTVNQMTPVAGPLLNEDINEYSDNEDNEDIESITSDGNLYDQLLELEDMDIIHNSRKFECIICIDEIDVGKGVKLHDCSHEFCANCLTDLIKASEEAPITCPFRDNEFICEGTIQHREMRYLVDDDTYEQYLYRSLQHAQKDLNNCFQCKTPDCRGLWEYEDNVASYQCPLCKQVNCHQCSAVHGTMSCRAYQQKIYDDTNPDALATRKMYDEMFANGKALRCPQCAIVIVREEGCSWVLCSICKTEICWATRGPRWGPKGKGDTSGGCQCDYKKGKPCHPNCTYCH